MLTQYTPMRAVGTRSVWSVPNKLVVVVALFSFLSAATTSNCPVAGTMLALFIGLHAWFAVGYTLQEQETATAH